MDTSDSTKPLSDILGARASNAGDAFHEIWALRAALQLLVPGTELKALTLEGIAAPEASGSRWDGVDCGLFLGGDTLSTARKVELVQLKYSTADPGKAWTVARLTANSAKKRNNSVLRKLAETYSSARQQMGSDAALAVRFISNQPLADAVYTTITAICRSEPNTDAANLVRDATGLDGGELKGFLEALDFSATGSASRQVLREEVTSAVSEILESDAGAEVRELLQRVRELMLPGTEREKVTLGSLLSWFGLSGVSGLFPVPADLRLVANSIPRVPANVLFDAVIGGERLVCVHGPAGCGKTTTMMQLPGLLPEGSVSAMFDCYGAGRYTHSNDRRHLPENAFLQFANELALNQGTPFLLARSGRNPATIRSFLERIERSAKILASAKPDAILAILIDAADNSVAAAERVTPHDPCFVWELLGADLTRLPANVRIVISSRTARKSGLHLPAGTREVICPAFTKHETTVFIRATNPDVSDAWIEQFHALSNGVPRVQNYALRKGGISLDAALNALRPRGKELDTVLRELFAEASAKAGNADFYDRCLAALAALPAPIPVEHVAALCATSAEAVMDFVRDVQPALRLELNTVTISDEDVEDFIQQEAGPRLTAIRNDICNYFAYRFRSDAYAAIHYADMLAKAARAAEILAIVEADLLPVAIADPIVRREVQLRRLRLALAACRSAGSGPDILKVVLLSAQAAKDEATLRNLLEKETDLSVRFARPSLVRLVLSDRDTYPEQGSVLLQDAARAAHVNDFVTARERLHAYVHWLRRRKDANAEQRHRWTIETDDLVARSEAIALVAGPQVCRDDLFRWRPVPLRLQVGLKLIPRLIARGRSDLVRKAYEDQLVAKPWSLVLHVPLILAGIAASQDHLEQELSSLDQASVPDLRGHHSFGENNWEFPFLETIVTACEIGFAAGIRKSVLETALKLILDHRSAPSRSFNRTDVQAIDIALRAWLLLGRLTNHDRNNTAASAFLREDNAPPPPKQRGRKKKKAPHNSGGQADDELNRTVQAIFPVYASRVELLSDAANNRGIVRGDTKAILKELGHDFYYLDQGYWGTDFRRRIAQSVVRLMHLQGVAVEQLYQQAELITKGRYADAFANRSYAVWQELLLRKSMHATLCDVVAKHALEARYVRTGAEDKTNAFIQFSRLLLNFSEDDARALFERAIEIAQEVDREALNQIEFIATLSKNLGDEPNESWKFSAVAHARFVTDVAIRLEGEEHFPWQEAVVGLSNLAPEVALAAIAQWQDEGVAGLQETLPTWLRELVDHHEQPSALACAFQILLPEPPVELVGHLARMAAAQRPISTVTLDMLASDCLLHAPPGEREQYAKTISEALPKDYDDGTTIQPLRALAARASLKNTDGRKAAESTKPQRLAIPPEFDFRTAQGIKDSIAWARKQEGYVPVDAVFAQMLDSVTSPKDRVPYLNAVSDFAEDSLDAGARAKAILDALALWTGQPAVDRWREHNLLKVIGDNLWPLSRWLGQGSDNLVELLDAAGLAGAARIDAIAKGLEAGAEHYSSKTLFAISEILVSSLSTAGARDILAWYTARLHSTVPPDIQTRFDAADIPSSLNAAIGRFLCGQLSDIDTRVRWRAAHCLRRLSSCFGTEPLLALFACYEQTTERSFRLPDAPYYWLAARLWAVIVAARVAEENPRAAATLAPKLVEIALDNRFPHFLVRQYAKAALESLLRKDAVALTSDITEKIHAVNLPKLAPAKAPRKYSRGLDSHERKERHFKFNSLDTIPYWYSPLFRLFAKLDADAFYAGLETWLLRRWKVDPEANWWDKEPRRARYDERDFGKWSHSHGSQPTVERYGTYLEWHAMFCALGEWLETEPLAISEYESDSLEHWAKGWSLSEPPTWMSDRRGFTPLERDLECDMEGDDKHWLRRIPRARFLDAALGASRPRRNDLTVDGAWTAAQLTREMRVSVRSALVSTEAAQALVRTMQDAKPYENSLPYGHERDDDIEVLPYRLKSWLQDLPHEVRFDSDDPLRHEISGLSVQPGDAITAAFGLKPGQAPVSSWYVGSEKAGFVYQTWADFGDEERERHETQRRVGTHGARLRIERALLQKFLARENLSLIMKIRIERRLENEYGRSKSWDNEGKENTIEKILLFHQDGTIEDRDGRIGTWAAARQRV